MKIGWGIEDARTKGMRTDECRMDASVEPKKGRRQARGERERSVDTPPIKTSQFGYSLPFTPHLQLPLNSTYPIFSEEIPPSIQPASPPAIL